MDPIFVIIGLTLGGFLIILIDLLFIPGGFFIAIGSCGILYSVYLTGQNFGILPAVAHLAVCLWPVPRLFTWTMNRVSLKTEMHKEDGFVGMPNRSHYIGMEGNAHTDLRPSGTADIMVSGTMDRLDCIAESGFIEKGSPVKVVAERGPSLLVRKL